MVEVLGGSVAWVFCFWSAFSEEGGLGPHDESAKMSDNSIISFKKNPLPGLSVTRRGGFYFAVKTEILLFDIGDHPFAILRLQCHDTIIGLCFRSFKCITVGCGDFFKHS